MAPSKKGSSTFGKEYNACHDGKNTCLRGVALTFTYTLVSSGYHWVLGPRLSLLLAHDVQGRQGYFG